MLEIRYYVTSGDQQPFDTWFADLESVARAKVTRAIVRDRVSQQRISRLDASPPKGG
jgi:hypothetical protein